MPIVGTPISSSSGWVTVQEADTYFGTRYGIGTKWSGLDTTAKTALLTTAQMPIELCTDYVWPDDDEITQAMKDAVCEQAYFMLLDPDMEARLALISQGVEEAGIVQEVYRRGASGNIPIAPLARKKLKSLENDDNHEIRLVR